MAKELSGLEKALIEFGKKYYKAHPYIDATCLETGNNYLLTWDKTHREPNEHYFTLYKKKENGFDVVEANKIVEGEKPLYTQLLFRY